MKKSLIIMPIIGFMLSGCVGTRHYDAGAYFMPISWGDKDEFKVLQLGDVHLSQSDYHEQHFAVIKRTIEATQPNLIVLNGDIFTYADKHTVTKFFDFINSFKIYWTYTFGNHDDQGYYPDTYIPRLLADDHAYSHVLFKNLEDDDVTGRSNFVISLRDSGHSIYQIIIMESHSYNYDTMKYDFIKQDQIDWYQRMIEHNNVPSSLYMHIGMHETVAAWDQSKSKEDQEGLVIGDMEEWGGSPDSDPGFYNKIVELGSTKSIHVAHDHANDSVMKSKEGVYFCFGVHSTNRIYNDANSVKFGGQVLRIEKSTLDVSFKNYYVNYENDNVTTNPTEGWASK